jgi:glycosyltransferase involved in cell wall biosynthesis
MMSPETGKVIWIINHYAGSPVHGMEYRHYCLAQQFRRMGWRPVILCASFHHLLTKLPEERTADVDGVPYVWIKACRYEKNDGRRVLNMLGFSARLALRRLRELPRPHVVIASSPHPFAAVNGYRLAKRYGAKFIFEVRDLWPLTIPEVGGHSPRHPFVRAMAWAERLGYQRCDWTVSLLGGAKDYMVAHGLRADKFVYVPNGIDAETSQGNVEPPPAEHDRIIRDLKGQGKLIILSGSHGAANALENLVEAAQLEGGAQGSLRWWARTEKELLVKQAQDAGLTNLTFLPRGRSQMAR